MREECRLRRRIFGPKTDEVKGEWRKLHIEEINDPYSQPNIIQVIKSRRMRWTGDVTCMGARGEVHTGYWWGTRGKETTWKTQL